MIRPGSEPLADLIGGGRRGLKSAAPYALLAAAVWLGWQIILAPVLERGPVDVVIRLAPGSPLVLRRAAESELAAKRFDDAEFLAQRALQAAPFDVRALSVAGMAIAERDRAAADDVLTLAGNWSLRDDPTHAWLMYERLRRGDYVSAFGHADTLVRRRTDIQPGVFRLFTAAATQDPRAAPPLIDLLAHAPPWREAYFDSLYIDPQGDTLLGGLAMGLQTTRGPLDERELGRLYAHWLGEGRVAAIQTVRRRLGRPAAGELVVNGDFSSTQGQAPFIWTLNQGAGFTAAILEDDLQKGQAALRVEYDGYDSGEAAHQFMLLPPGAYRLSFEARIDGDSPKPDLAWMVRCSNSTVAAKIAPDFSPGDKGWKRFETDFEITSACPGQWVVLTTIPGERRGARRAIWFDRVRIETRG